MGNKMYILDNGYMGIDKNQMVALATLATVDNERPCAEWIQIPIYCVLIESKEKGWILFDTGCHPDGMKGRWSPMSCKVAPHYTTEDQLLVNQLAKVGVKPGDIKTVLLSHMHCDHAGGLFLFKDTAEVYVNRDDFRQSLFTVFASQDPNASGGTCRADVIEPVQRYRFLGNKDYKIAPGVTLVYLPGHSAGMMGLLVELDGGNFLFPLDILNMAANYRPKTVPSAIVYDSVQLMASVERVRELEAEYNAAVMFPHDMAQFKTFKKAPDCYQ